MTPRSTYSVVTANVWRENPQIQRDLATLCRTGAHVIGINEGAGYSDQIKTVAASSGYRAIGVTGRGPERQNPILLRDDATDVKWTTRRISRRVGISPERVAVGVTFTLDGVRRAHINVHMNSHVQAGAAKPHALPRVTEYVAGAKILVGWVAELEAAGYIVTVTGDLNWAWSARPVQWAYSPKRMFDRIGFVSQYDYGVLPRPRGDERPIEYVLFRPNGYDVTQRYVTPEKSDHPWIEVTLTHKESA